MVIDGVSVGQTPLDNYPVEIGTRDVQVKSAAGNRRLSIPATVKPVVVDVDFSKPKVQGSGFRVQGSRFGLTSTREP